jgi:hypothetical protein
MPDTLRVRRRGSLPSAAIPASPTPTHVSNVISSSASMALSSSGVRSVMSV